MKSYDIIHMCGVKRGSTRPCCVVYIVPLIVVVIWLSNCCTIYLAVESPNLWHAPRPGSSAHAHNYREHGRVLPHLTTQECTKLIAMLLVFVSCVLVVSP